MSYMTTAIHTSTYEGRTITVALFPRSESKYSARGACYEVFVNGRTYQGGSFPVEHPRMEVAENGARSHVRDADGNRVWDPLSNVEKNVLLTEAIKKGRQWVDRDIADEALRPVLAANIDCLPRGTEVILHTYTNVEDYTPGDVVWFHSRGNYRKGVVEKIGRVNVGVAYVTKDTPKATITRMSLKPAEVGFDIEAVS